MEDFLELVKTRQSTRGLYDASKPISKEDLGKILEAASWAPTPHNMQNFEVIVVDDPKTLEAIGGIKFAVSPGMVEENNLHSSATVEELIEKKTGILRRVPAAFTEQGGNPVDYFSQSMQKTFLASSALLIVMYDSRKRAPGSEGDFLGKIGLGCVMENMCVYVVM